MSNHRIMNKQGSNVTLSPLLDTSGNALTLAPKGTKGDEKEIDAETAENEIVTRMKGAGWIDVRPVMHNRPPQQKSEPPPPPPPPAPEPKAEEPPPAAEVETSPPPAPEPEPAPEPAPEPVAPFETTLPTETATSSETATPPSKPKRR